MPNQQSLSNKVTGLPVLNQYLARINVSCSRSQSSDAVRVEPAAPQFRVKHSTTEALLSLKYRLYHHFYSNNVPIYIGIKT